jgi:hypothetical protein
MRYRYRATDYEVVIRRAPGSAGESTRVTLDGVAQRDSSVPLVDDRQEHHVTVEVPGPF